MKRTELEHVVRAAADIVDDELVVIELMPESHREVTRKRLAIVLARSER